MGRKPDTPEQQAAKGNPGRRRAKIAQRVRDQDAVVLAVSSGSVEKNIPAPPPFLLEKTRKGALAIWNEMSPRLHSTGRLDKTHQLLFANFCIYAAEFISADNDIARYGGQQLVTTISGSDMWKDTPAVRLRERAQKNMMDLSARFGLTPLDMNIVFRGQVRLNDRLGGEAPGLPLNDSIPGEIPPLPRPSADAPAAAYGALDDLGDPPEPGHLN